MNKFYALLLFLVPCCCYTSFAQSDFRPGYIVQATGDTLSGFVGYKESRASNKLCSFKQDEKGKAQQFSPDDINAYGFKNDRAYIVKTINSGEKEGTKAFVEILVRGHLSLYTYQARFFVEKEKDLLLELKYTEEDTYVNNTRIMKRLNEHIATLNSLMADCSIMINKIEAVSLSERSLVSLVKDYNECIAPGETTTFKDDKKWLKIKVGVGAAANTESLAFSASDRRLAVYDNSRFSTVNYPSAGVLFNIASPRLKERLSLQVEGFYSAYEYTGHSNYTSSSDDVKYRNDYSLQLTSFKINTAFRYTFSSKVIQPYINVGASNRLLLSNKAYRRQEAESFNTVDTSEHTDLFLNNHHFGLLAGLGANVKVSGFTLFSEVRYDRGMHIATPPESSYVSRALKSGSNTFSFIAGLYF